MTFLEDQMHALLTNAMTEDEVCNAIENEVCQGLARERELEEMHHYQSMLRDQSILHTRIKAIDAHYEQERIDALTIYED